jgi:hypothetical protein
VKFALSLGLLIVGVALAAPVNFNQDVAPVIYEKCSRCHRPGQSAPFPLMSYEDVAKRGKLIAAVTASRYMPPWKAEPASFPYLDSRRLSDAQLALIQTWVKEGMQRGGGQAPPLPKFPEGWQLGPPNLIVEMPKAFNVPAEGPDVYRNVVIPLNLKQDEWVQAVELHPSSRGVVHHVLYFADTTGNAHKMGAGNIYESQGMRITGGMIPIGGVAGGSPPHLLPNGLALKLPKATDLILQYHFHPSGKPEIEQSKIGLYFAKKAPEHTLTGIQLPPSYGMFSNLKIPAGQKEYKVTDSYTLPVDVEAVGVGAHTHYLGKTMKITATLPNGQVKTLLMIKDWDFSWQDRYLFEHTVSLPKGTRIDGELTWDNSAQNPRNPSNPPVAVKWSEETKGEMGSVSLQVYPRNEADLKTLASNYRRHLLSIALPRLIVDSELRKWVRERFGGFLSGGSGGTE